VSLCLIYYIYRSILSPFYRSHTDIYSHPSHIFHIYSHPSYIFYIYSHPSRIFYIYSYPSYIFHIYSYLSYIFYISDIWSLPIPFCFITELTSCTPEGGLEAFADALFRHYRLDIPYEGGAEHTPLTKDKAGRRDG